MSNIKYVHISNPKLLLSILLKNTLDESLKKLEDKSLQETSDIFSLKRTSDSLLTTLSNLSISPLLSLPKSHNKKTTFIPPDSSDDILNTIPVLHTPINFYKNRKDKKERNSILKTLIEQNKTPTQVSKFFQKDNMNNNINNNTNYDKRSNKKVFMLNTPVNSINIKKSLIQNLTSSNKNSYKFMLSNNYDKKSTIDINRSSKYSKVNINKQEFLEANNDTSRTPVLKIKFDDKKSKLSVNKKKTKNYSPGKKNKFFLNVTTGRKKYHQSDTRSLTPINPRKHRNLHKKSFDLSDKKSNYSKKSKIMKASNSFRNNKIEKNREYDINTISQELELLCNNTNLLENDIRLDELKINETPPRNSSPKFKTATKEQSDDKLKSLCDSLLKIVNKDELLVKKNRNSKIFSNLFLPNVNMNNPRKSFAINSNIELLTLEEKLEGSIEYMIDYLNIFDLFNFCRINKEFFRIIIKIFVEKTERKIEILNEYINYLKPTSTTDVASLKLIKPFECNVNSIRAITLLNSISKNNLFSYRDILINNKDIELIFDLYFVALGKKMDLMKFENNLIKKWQYICRYFRENNFNLLGNLIQKDLIHKSYSNEIINTLYECAYDSLDKITPNYYQKINKNIAILVFIIRDLLEFYGIGQNISSNSVKLFMLHSARLEVQEKLLNKFNKLLKITD